MIKIQFINFWLLLTMGMITIVFSSCSKDDTLIVVTGISLDKSTMTLLVGEEQTLTATVTPENATDKVVIWTSSDESKAIVSKGKVTAIAEGIATITAKAGNQTAISIISVKDGVRINGIIWAKYNVATPGTFTVKPEDPGMFYQWNRKIAWTVTNNVTGWDATVPEGTTWEKANDPSPAGWRVPTFDEIKTLCESEKVSYEWTTENSINGMKFVDKTNGNSIFLPAPGLRNYFDGTLLNADSFGVYWSSTPNNETVGVFALQFADWSGPGWSTLGVDRRYGCNVRCVAD